MSDDIDNLRDRVRSLSGPVTAKGKKKRGKKVPVRLARQRTLYVKFPADDDLAEFETVDFGDISVAKAFVEETEVDAAMIMNGEGSYITAFIKGHWFSYV